MLRKFIAARPGDPFPRYGLAQEYKNGGRLAEAREEFSVLLREYPDYTAGYLHAGNVAVGLGPSGRGPGPLRAGDSRLRPARRRPRQRRAGRRAGNPRGVAAGRATGAAAGGHFWSRYDASGSSTAGLPTSSPRHVAPRQSTPLASGRRQLRPPFPPLPEPSRGASTSWRRTGNADSARARHLCRAASPHAQGPPGSGRGGDRFASLVG